jgi:hypothetical protein
LRRSPAAAANHLHVAGEQNLKRLASPLEKNEIDVQAIALERAGFFGDIEDVDAAADAGQPEKKIFWRSGRRGKKGKKGATEKRPSRASCIFSLFEFFFAVKTELLHHRPVRHHEQNGFAIGKVLVPVEAPERKDKRIARFPLVAVLTDDRCAFAPKHVVDPRARVAVSGFT